MRPGMPDRELLRYLVTPESLPDWGDFSEAATLLAGCGMTSRASASMDDPDVVYIKYVTDSGQSFQVQREIMIMARAVGTLVHRPKLGGWRVHAVGDYVRPEQVPHD
jgi:hypothetical protein